MKGVEEAICVSRGWLREVVMAGINGVRDKGGFCGSVDDSEAAVVLQGGGRHRSRRGLGRPRRRGWRACCG